MNNLKALTEELKAARNPGHKIGEFLLDHSNSHEYLEAHLEAFLEAVRADRKAENKFLGGLLKKEAAAKSGE